MRSYARKLLLPLLVIAASAGITLVAYRACAAPDAGVASAPTAVDMAVAAGNETALLTRAYDAVTHGDYAPAAIILLIAAVWFVRMDHTKIPVVGALIDKTFGKLVRWSRSDRGGVFAVFVTSILGGVLHTITVGGIHALSWGTLKTAGILGVAAIGGFTGVKRLFFPSDVVDSTEAKTDPGKPTPPPTPPAA